MPIYTLTLLVLFPRHCNFFYLKRYRRKVFFCLVWVLIVVISDLKVGKRSLQLEVLNTKSWLFEILLTGDLLSFYYLLVRKYHCRHSCLSRMILEGGKIHIFTVIVIAICTKFLRDIHRFCFVFFLNKTSD